jgi:hypothetical protein
VKVFSEKCSHISRIKGREKGWKQKGELEEAFFIMSVGTTAVTQAILHMKPILVRNLLSVSPA